MTKAGRLVKVSLLSLLSLYLQFKLRRVQANLLVLRSALCNTIMACKGERKTASSLGPDLRTLISVPQTSQ
jgi:hypothetical protein